MSRASYGADVFSPVRGDAFFNGALCDEKDNDYFGLWQEPYDAVGKIGNSEVKEKDSSISFLHKDESPAIDNVPDNLQSIVKTGSVVGKKNKKVSSTEDDLSRLSYVTTRSRSSHKNEKKLEVIRESKSTHNGIVSKARKKADRSEMHSNKDLTSSKIKQNKDSALSLAFSADSNKELPHSKTNQRKDISSSAAISAESSKEFSAMKIKQNKDSSPSSTISADSNKEFPLMKVKKNKDSSSSSTISADSNKEFPLMKVKKNKDSSSSSTISADSNKEFPPMKIKKNKDSSSSSTISADSYKKLLSSKMTQSKDSLTSLAKEQPEKSPTFNVQIDPLKPGHNYPGLSDEQVQPRKVLSKRNVMSKKNQSKSKIIVGDGNVAIEQCTQIEETDEMNLNKENKRESENSNAESASSSSVSKPEQIQANIIEKLVKDAVSFEFDGIRQMLYLHQLQVLRNIDRNNVCCCELQKANDDLVEENRRLKILIAQQKT